eukprot:Awhi_evm1s13860
MSVDQSPAWKALQAHFDAEGDKINIRNLCAESGRFEKYSQKFSGSTKEEIL